MKIIELKNVIEKTINGEWGTDEKNNENDIYVIRTTNFCNDGSINYEKLLKRNIDKNKIEQKILQIGDIIVEKSGGTDKNPVGRVVLFENKNIRSLTNNFTQILRIKKEYYYKYIFYQLLYKYKCGSTLQMFNKTTGIQNLQMKMYTNQKINICDKEEQINIANILDKVQEVINKRKKQINELDKLIKSQFMEMFGDPISNNKNWSEVKLSQLGILERGTSRHRPRNAPELLGGKYPLIQTGDVSNSGLYIKEYSSTYSDLGLKQSRMWNKGTLCITIAANIAQTSILTFDACFPDSVVGLLTNDNVSNIFMHYWFSFLYKIIDAQATQVAQKNINLKILNNLDVILPPIELQNQFSDIVKQIDKQKAEIQESLQRIEELQESLMNKYFSINK